jgi:transcriptional regulator with XRE-family HTH domain
VPRTKSSVLEGRAAVDRGLGECLARARVGAGLTQLAAARAVGLPQSAIAKMEGGKRQLRFLEGVRLAGIYGVDCRDLDPARGEVDLSNQ